MVAAVETMAWTGEEPWHHEGVKVAPDLTPEEMMIAAGLECQQAPRLYHRYAQVWRGVWVDSNRRHLPLG